MFPYDVLWHYSEKFTRDPDLRQDLVLLAWKESKRLGVNVDVRLLKNYIKLRSREIARRSPLGVDISGKSVMDVWNHDQRIGREKNHSIESTLSSYATNPFGMCVVNDFEESLPTMHAHVAQEMIAGYTQRESAARLGMSAEMFRKVREAVRERALEYLV